MFLDNYLPAITATKDAFFNHFVALMNQLDAIHETIRDASSEPAIHDKMNRITGVQANGDNSLGKCPLNQYWVIDAVAASGAWSIILNGVLFLASTNGQNWTPPVILPGEEAIIRFAAPTDYTVHITRKYIDQDKPRKARSGTDDKLPTGIGPLHETGRDLIQRGIPQRPAPPAYTD